VTGKITEGAGAANSHGHNSDNLNTDNESCRGLNDDEQVLSTIPKTVWETLVIRHGANLPHWSCDRAIYHVVFRLADSIPSSVLNEWRLERDAMINMARKPGRDISEDELKRVNYLFSEKIEQYLDAGHGSCWLQKPEIAMIIAENLQHFEGKKYRLHAWCIMPNHVHVIVEPINSYLLSRIIHSWKSFTATKANKMLGLNGQFWQHEPYDHIIRSKEAYRFLCEYIWQNPEKAGLRHWPWRTIAWSDRK